MRNSESDQGYEIDPGSGSRPYKEQGRIVYRSGLNNENNEIKMKNTKNQKSEDFIFLTVQ